MPEWTADLPETREEILARPEMDGWPWDLYKAIIQPVRTLDQQEGDRFLERFFRGPNFVAARIALIYEDLFHLIEVDDCPEEFLHLYALRVGLPEDVIVAALGQQPGDDQYLLLRSMCKVGPFIKHHTGSPLGLSLWIQAATGRKPVILYQHDDEAILDEALLDVDFILWPEGPAYTVLYPWDETDPKTELVEALIRMNHPFGFEVLSVPMYLFDEFSSDLSQWEATGGLAEIVEDCGLDPMFEEI